MVAPSACPHRETMCIFFTLSSVLLNDVASDHGTTETLAEAGIDFESSQVC